MPHIPVSAELVEQMGSDWSRPVQCRLVRTDDPEVLDLEFRRVAAPDRMAHLTEVDGDGDEWSMSCSCGMTVGGLPDADTAADTVGDHLFAAGVKPLLVEGEPAGQVVHLVSAAELGAVLAILSASGDTDDVA